MLRHRLAFGAALILVLLLTIWLDGVIDRAAVPESMRALAGGRATFPPGVALFSLAILGSPLAAYEFSRILREANVRSSAAVTWVAVLAGLCVSCLVPRGIDGVRTTGIVSTVAVCVAVGGMIWSARRASVAGAVASTGGLLLAFVYLGLMFGFILAIRRERSEWFVLGVLAITKSCDIGAYFTGRLIGRNKLIPWLSPGKTWEGLAGGVALATAVGAAAAAWLQQSPEPLRLEVWQGALGGAILGLAGQAGDLTASLLKRDAGRKDASRSLPGFGGLLDIIDSPLLAAPVAYWLLVLAAIPDNPPH